MAARSLGTLTIDLVAKIGGFVQGMTEAERKADKSAKAIEASINGMGVAAFALGNALGGYIKQGIDALVSSFPDLIEQVAKFQDIADKTGGSAEGFANFAVSAKVAGVEIEAIADASTKLSKQLIDVNSKTSTAAAGLKALGINTGDFLKLKPDEQIEKLAEAFNQFADGGEKAAVAQQLFGKSGAELVKFFKDYAESGGKVTILTQQMIKQADDFADAQSRAKAQISLYAAAAATEAIPAIQALTGVAVDLIKELTGVGQGASDLKANDGVRSFANAAGEVLAGLLDVLKTTKAEFAAFFDFFASSATAAKQALSFDFSAAAQTGADFRKKYGLDEFGRKVSDAGTEAGRSYVQKFKDSLAANARSSFAGSDPRRLDGGKVADSRPTLKPISVAGGGGGAKDDPTKKLLDNELKSLEAFINSEKELMSTRQKFLDLFNSQGLISVKDYYDQQNAIRDEAYQKQNDAYNAEIEALKKYQAAAGKATERADAQGKINEVIEKQTKLQRENGNAALEAGIKQVQAQKEVKDAYDEVNAKILELKGNLGEAAAIRFDASNDKLKKIFDAEGNQQGKEALQQLRDYTISQAEINKLTQSFSLAQGDLQIAEERISIARERGTIGEIESLQKSGEARRKTVALLEDQLAAYEKINAAARTPEQEQAIQRLKLQLEGLKATIDPLADKFNTLLSDAAGNAFGDFITGTKSAKEAFKDFSKTVISEIAKMAAKDLAKSLFGGGDSGGTSFGSLLSGLLGGASGGSSGGDALGDFIKLGGYASGGFTGMGAANDPAGIVHKGEYVLNAEQTRKIGVANLNSGNFGGSNVFNINVPDTVSRQTGSQIAAEAQRKLAQGSRNR